jgi:hypothetical protein
MKMRRGKKNMITKNYITQNIRSMNNRINKFMVMSIHFIEKTVLNANMSRSLSTALQHRHIEQKDSVN